MNRRLLMWWCVASAAWPALAPAQSARCEASATSTPAVYLRQLYLDLEGRAPRFEEYQEVTAGKATVDEVLERLLNGEGFRARIGYFHRELLWPNLQKMQLFGGEQLLIKNADGNHYRQIIARFFRGDYYTSCVNEPARIVDGVIQVNAQGQEGWVEVEPYWAKGTTIRVCAFDAQATVTTKAGVRCNSATGNYDTACGCGPNLNYCQGYIYRASGTITTENLVREAFEKEVLQMVDDVVKGDLPYSDVLTRRRGYVNGPTAHFWKYQSERSVYPSSSGLFASPGELPDIDYLDETLRPIERPGLHSGVLTAPAFLLRFQTNRSRANRFSNAFLCSAFTPPSQGLPAPDSDCAKEPDLQKRCGCKYCHVGLEPMAASWGRFTQAGLTYLDPKQFPLSDVDCRDCATTGRTCSTRCATQYVTNVTNESERAFLGRLKESMFLNQTQQDYLEQGPRFLVERSLFQGKLADCICESVWRHFMNRPMTAQERASLLGDLSARFAASNYNLKTLVKAIVTSQAYRTRR
jgi:hypothetical protein